MEDTFKIDIERIKKLKLNLQEYCLLTFLYYKKTKQWTKLIDSFGPVSNIHMNSLQSKGYIKICNDVKDCKKTTDVFELRNKAINIFEGDIDYFLRWLSKFPIKTPSGRYLSTKDEDTIKGKKLRKKWTKLFKNNVVMQKKAIEVLEAEMDWRRRTGKFEYMHNAETWLNQGNFEVYEYLLEDKDKIKRKLREDFE